MFLSSKYDRPPFMKKLLYIFCFFLTPAFSLAQQVAGYISAQYVSAYTYKITVTDYVVGDTNSSSPCDSLKYDTVRIFYGDGTSDLLTRSNGNGDSICPCTKECIYSSTHTFPGAGSYHIWCTLSPRVPDIVNMTNSSTQSMIIFNALNTQFGGTSSPTINTALACSYGCTSDCYNFYSNAVLPPAISYISSVLGDCSGAGYYIPSGATVDNVGDITWCNPPANGLYNFAIYVISYEQIFTGAGSFTAPVDTMEVELQATIQNDCLLGVNEVQNAKKLELFPNPNNGIFTIRSSEFIPIAIGSQPSVVIYNMLGQQIANSQWPSANSQIQMDLSSQLAGIFLYRIITKAGQLVSTGKFVIEK